MGGLFVAGQGFASAKEILHTVFHMYSSAHEKADGEMGMMMELDLYEFFLTVFKFLFKINDPSIGPAKGTTPMKLAAQTVERLFVGLGTERASGVSFEDFSAWMSSNDIGA